MNDYIISKKDYTFLLKHTLQQTLGKELIIINLRLTQDKIIHQ